MNEALKDISVIIPFTKDDLLWKDLLQDLRVLPAGSEIILVGPDSPDADVLSKATEGLISTVRYVPAPKGRGVQLNRGVIASEKQFFWFLHADSRVPRPAISRLVDEIRSKPHALHFFHLQFLADGPRWVGLNSFGANLRSRYLRMPFGDQGFCVHRNEFQLIGGFAENVPYGEDHEFVWEARRKHVPLNEVPAAIFTSARTYERHGWGKVTRQRVMLTAFQATRECWKLFKQRVVEKI